MLGAVAEREHGPVRPAGLARERHRGNDERAARVDQLDLGFASFGAPEHVLDQRAHLGLADRLEIVAPEG